MSNGLTTHMNGTAYSRSVRASQLGCPSPNPQGGTLSSIFDDATKLVRDFEATQRDIARIEKNTARIEQMMPYVYGGLFAIAGGLVFHGIISLTRK